MGGDLLLINKVGESLIESYNLGRIHNYTISQSPNEFEQLKHELYDENIGKEQLEIATELLHAIMKAMARDLEAIENLPTKILDCFDEIETLGKQKLIKFLLDEHGFELQPHI